MRAPSIAQLLAATAVATVAAIAMAWTYPLTGNTWWPIAVSHLLHAGSTTYHSDPLSPLPIRDGSWHDMQPLTSLLLRGLYELGGVVALAAAACLLAGLTAAGIAGLCMRLGARPLAALGGTAGALVFLADHPLEGQTLAMAWFVLLLLLLERGRTWSAVPVLLAWAWSHPSVVVGVVYCLLHAAGLSGLHAPAGGRARRTRWALAVVTIPLLTPAGTLVYTYTSRVSTSPYLAHFSGGWSHATPGSAAIVLCLVAISALGAAEAKRYRLLVPVAVMALAALIYQRNVVWLAIVAAPCWALILQTVLPEVPGRQRVWCDRRAGLGSIAVAAGVLLAAVAVACAVAPWRSTVVPDRVLVALPAGARVFTHAATADQIVVRRRAQVFVDSRVERFQRDSLGAYVRMLAAEPAQVEALAGCGASRGSRWRWLLLEDVGQQARLVAAVRRGRVGDVDVRVVASRGGWYLFRLACRREG